MISQKSREEIRPFQENFAMAKENYDRSEESVLIRRIELRHLEKVAEDAYNETGKKQQELILHLRNYIPDNIVGMINIMDDHIMVNDGKTDIVLPKNEEE